jgi:hypothetical protein
MISDPNEAIKQLERAPLGRSKVDTGFEALDREWSTSVSKSAVNLYLHDIGESIKCTVLSRLWNTRRVGRRYDDDR